MQSPNGVVAKSLTANGSNKPTYCSHVCRKSLPNRARKMWRTWSFQLMQVPTRAAANRRTGGVRGGSSGALEQVRTQSCGLEGRFRPRRPRADLNAHAQQGRTIARLAAAMAAAARLALEPKASARPWPGPAALKGTPGPWLDAHCRSLRRRRARRPRMSAPRRRRRGPPPGRGRRPGRWPSAAVQASSARCDSGRAQAHSHEGLFGADGRPGRDRPTRARKCACEKKQRERESGRRQATRRPTRRTS